MIWRLVESSGMPDWGEFTVQMTSQQAGLLDLCPSTPLCSVLGWSFQYTDPSLRMINSCIKDSNLLISNKEGHAIKLTDR